ncbi:MAG: BatA domain-containing protein [Rhodothermales bacterium]
MLQFVSPLLLLAMLSLIVPLLIHLWSRGTGRRVRVGSLRFLEETERSRLRAIKLSQRSLLLVRSALLSLLVLLLAGLVWIEPPSTDGSQPERWVLVHPEALTTTDANLHRTLDSLGRAGASMRLLASGLPPVDLNRREPTQNQESMDVWSLLREADWRLPRGSSITVVAPNRLATLRGERPGLRATVTWIPIQTKHTNRWIESARRVGTDSLNVILGQSSPRGTLFEQYQVYVSTDGEIHTGVSELALDVDADGQQVSLRRVDDLPEDDVMPVDPAHERRRVVLYHTEPRQDDARYVAAAMRAVSELSRLPITISMGSDWDSLPADFDVLFWLSEEPAPVGILNRVEEGLLLISDAKGDDWHDVQRRIVLDAVMLETPATLTQRVMAEQEGRVTWTDSSGDPLLERETVGSGIHYRFHSRFHPSSGTFVQSSAFPEWIWWLLHGDEDAEKTSKSDLRRIATNQLMPRQQRATPVHGSTTDTMPLHGPLWIVAFLLFIVERWMAHRQTP